MPISFVLEPKSLTLLNWNTTQSFLILQSFFNFDGWWASFNSNNMFSIGSSCCLLCGSWPNINSVSFEPAFRNASDSYFVASYISVACSLLFMVTLLVTLWYPHKTIWKAILIMTSAIWKTGPKPYHTHTTITSNFSSFLFIFQIICMTFSSMNKLFPSIKNKFSFASLSQSHFTAFSLFILFLIW